MEKCLSGYLLTTLHQIFYKIILNSKIIAKCMRDPDNSSLEEPLSVNGLIPALSMWAARDITRPHARLASSCLGMDESPQVPDLIIECSFDSQATWVIDVLGV